MRPNSGVLKLMNSQAEPYTLESWGGCYDGNQSDPRGATASAQWRFGRRVFSGTDNDLVVSTHSATGRGTRQPIVHCGHSQYFEEPAVCTRLRRL